MAVALDRLRGGSVDVPINLLPAEVRADQRMRKLFNGALFAAGVVVLLLLAITALQRKAVSDAKHDLAVQTARATQLQGQVGSLSSFGAMEARILSTRHSLATALVGDVAWTRFMTDLSRTIPNDSWVSSLSLNAVPGTAADGVLSYGTAQYSGSVASFPGLSGWLTAMAKLNGLHFVYLGSGTKGAGGIVTFSANANLTPAILSGRCQTETAPCP
jgi:Tfp pilus assembly protein PilN